MTATEPVLITYKKPWWKCRILWFNAIVAALVRLEASFSLLQPHITPKQYALGLLVVTLINAFLRVVTTQGLRK